MFIWVTLAAEVPSDNKAVAVDSGPLGERSWDSLPITSPGWEGSYPLENGVYLRDMCSCQLLVEGRSGSSLELNIAGEFRASA